jgi:hypothetical protein
MILTLAALFSLATLVAGQSGSGLGQKKDKAAPSPGKSALEKALEQALANNPDVKVAQAKASEAEAQLSRTRLQVLQKVVAAYRDVENGKVSVEAAEVQLKQLKAQRTVIRSGVTDSELRQAEVQLASAKTTLDKAQADLDFLMGKAPASLKTSGSLSSAILGQRLHPLSTMGNLQGLTAVYDPNFFQVYPNSFRSSLLLSSHDPLALLTSQVPPRGPATDRIRKVLDQKVNLKFSDTPARDVLKMLQKVASDLHIQAVTRDDGWSEKMTANLVDVSFAAALQLLEDTLPGHRVVVREYGLLIVPEAKVPPNAVRLNEFLKSKTETRTTTTSKAPPANIEGLVKRVEGALATVSVGSDAGLKKGQTLEVYRLGPKPLYLGRLRIVDVTATQAVGELVGKAKEAIKAGDQVSSAPAGGR